MDWSIVKEANEIIKRSNALKHERMVLEVGELLSKTNQDSECVVLLSILELGVKEGETQTKIFHRTRYNLISRIISLVEGIKTSHSLKRYGNELSAHLESHGYSLRKIVNSYQELLVVITERDRILPSEVRNSLHVIDSKLMEDTYYNELIEELLSLDKNSLAFEESFSSFCLMVSHEYLIKEGKVLSSIRLHEINLTWKYVKNYYLQTRFQTPSE